MRRVVITGLGAVSPHGLGTAAYWNAVLEGKSSVTALARFDGSAFESRVAGQLPAFKTTEYVPKSYRKATKIMARDIELAVVAANFAVKDAHLATKGILEGTTFEQLPADGNPWHKTNPERVGCNIGAGLICADLNELTDAMVKSKDDAGVFSLEKWGTGMENLTPLWLLKYLPNMLACHVSIIHDTQGPSNTITCGQASAGLSLAEAARSIQRGSADIALVGGCESKVNPMALMRWSLLHRLVTNANETPATACRPLDAAATGTVLAEGGAVLVIEELEHAKARGAKIYAELGGFGATSNGSYVIEPDASGEAVAAAIGKALRDAEISPEAVNLVIPPSCGVPKFDHADAAALKLAFGNTLPKTHIVPLRGGIGDCGAGSQALDLVGGALALHAQAIPPAVNCPQPIAGLNVAQAKIAGPLDCVVVIGSALGGQNSAVVLKRYS